MDLSRRPSTTADTLELEHSTRVAGRSFCSSSRTSRTSKYVVAVTCCHAFVAYLYHSHSLQVEIVAHTRPLCTRVRSAYDRPLKLLFKWSHALQMRSQCVEDESADHVSAPALSIRNECLSGLPAEFAADEPAAVNVLSAAVSRLS